MRKRITTGICFLTGIIALLLLAKTWWYAAVCATVDFWITWEYLRAVGLLSNLCLSIPSLLMALAAPLLTFLPRNFDGGVSVLLTVIVGYIVSLALLSVLFFRRAETKDISVVSFGTLYMTVAMSSLVILSFAHPDYSVVMVLPVMIAALVTDTCAFFVGICIGKHKLAPELSPKKTVEGGIGGVVCCVIVFYIYAWAVSRLTNLSPRWILVGICGFVASILAQAGDLLMSKIKRETGIKDFGTVFPGHGGMLDRFDSMLPTAIVCLFFVLLPNSLSLFH